MEGDQFLFVLPASVDPGKRLDRVLAEDLGLARRNQLKNQLRNLRCNGRPAKLSTGVNPGDRIEGVLAAPPQQEARGQPITLDLVYEEEDFLVIDKPQGLVVHPGAGNPDGTVVNALLWRYRDNPYFTPDGSPEVRPGIVHRLDKDTSGIMVIAKTPDAHHHLVEQFSRRGALRKRYLAILRGTPRQRDGVIDAAIGRDPRNRQRFATNVRNGKPARTAWHVLRRLEGYALVLLCPETGRTHQLRVHMASQRTPILGDPVYSRKDAGFPEATLMLHALTITLSPAPGRPPMTFRSAVPQRFYEILYAGRTGSDGVPPEG